MTAKTTPKTYRLTPADLENIRKIRKAAPHLRTDTDAIRLALAHAAAKT